MTTLIPTPVKSKFDYADQNVSRIARSILTGVPATYTSVNNLTCSANEVAFIDKITLRAVTNDADTNFTFTIEVNGEELPFHIPSVLDSRRGDILVLEPGGNMCVQPSQILRIKASTALLGTFTIHYRKYPVATARELGLLNLGYPQVASTNSVTGSGTSAATAKEIVAGVAGHAIEVLGFYLTGHSYNAAADSIALGFWEGSDTFYTPPDAKATSAHMVFVGHVQGASIVHAPRILVNDTKGCIQGPAGHSLYIQASTNLAGATPKADYVVMYRLVPVKAGNFLMDMRLNATVSTTVTSLVMTENIPADTPATGTVNVRRSSGAITAIAYSAYSGATFTITSTDFSSDNAPAGGDVTFNRPHSFVNDPTGAVGQPVRRRSKWWASTIAAPIPIDAGLLGAEPLPPIFGSYATATAAQTAQDSLVKVRGYAGSFRQGRPTAGTGAGAFTGVSGMVLGATFGTSVSFLGNIGLTDANPNGADVDTSTHVCEPDELALANMTSGLALMAYESGAGDHPARFQLAWGEFATQKSSGAFAIQMA